MIHLLGRLLGVLVLVWIALACSACDSERAAGPGAGEWITTPSGLAYIDLVIGTGAVLRSGDTASIHYTLWLEDGTKIDSSRDRDVPLEFPVGEGRVIAGVDEGLLGVRVGGQRRLIIPPELGYGDRGAGDIIPPNAQLTFEAELLAVQQTQGA